MRLLATVLGAVFACQTAAAYYHFVRFPSRSGPFTPIYEKFDLNALPGRTLRYYIADSGPDRLAASDSFAAVVSQIKLAAKAWNDVDSSELRLVFGGLINPATPQTSPGIDVIFDDDIPPGVIAMAGPVTYDYSALPTGAAFVPIVRSKMRLRKDLTRFPLAGGGVEEFATFDEMFFGTLVHEFGHTLGLQHSFTSGAMSTRPTRGTSKARPLTADDIAGISVLYPNANFGRNMGSIRGRVTTGGVGVNMASVVAISPTGAAVSALTNPDGTYRIDGIPAGITYFVYAHPLPSPDAVDPLPGGILQPWDSLNARGSRITTRDIFSTVFHPQTFVVTAGEIVDNVNFNVTRRSSLPIQVVQTYGFVGQVTVKPPQVEGSSAAGRMVAFGLAQANGAPLQGLTVRVLGGGEALPGSVRAYPFASQYIQFDVQPPFGEGLRHLVFSAGGDQYVLPAAFNLIQRPPPVVESVSAAMDDRGGRAALVSGRNLSGDSRILFDGWQSTILKTNADGSLLVSLPPAPGGHHARVVALNTDGQSSLFAQGRGAAQFAYDAADSGFFSLSTNAVPAGSDVLIEVTGTGTNFVDGQTTLGFGSSDIAVRRVWVASPTKLYANVSILPHSSLASTTVTVTSGLQLFSTQFGFQIQPLNSRQLSLNFASLRNAAGGAGVTAGGQASIAVNNLTSQAGVRAFLNDQPLTISAVNGNTITFQVPADLKVGPAVLRVQNGAGESSLPIAINIDAPPPVIQAALAGVSAVLEPGRWVRPNELMTLVVNNLYENVQQQSAVRVNVGGVIHSPIAILGAAGGTQQVQVILSSSVPTGEEIPVTVGVETRVSEAIPITIRAN